MKKAEWLHLLNQIPPGGEERLIRRLRREVAVKRIAHRISDDKGPDSPEFIAFLEASEELDMRLTAKLMGEAEDLGIPTPWHYPTDEAEEDENWVFGRVYGDWIMTTRGQATIRDLIRVERKARLETFGATSQAWGTVVSAVTGLGGIAVAIITLLSKS